MISADNVWLGCEASARGISLSLSSAMNFALALMLFPPSRRLNVGAPRPGVLLPNTDGHGHDHESIQTDIETTRTNILTVPRHRLF